MGQISAECYPWPRPQPIYCTSVKFVHVNVSPKLNLLVALLSNKSWRKTPKGGGLAPEADGTSFFAPSRTHYEGLAIGIL